jgi:ATP-binding cassette subfamily F protein 2
MMSIDALARAIKEFEGGVVFVSHDFRTFTFSYHCSILLIKTLGLISQVAEELWEVKDKKIRNLTKVRNIIKVFA